ncbi:hypothetical protein [Aeromonas rivipollensis]|uniref:hypothetical protein n=1 Tax=Aeromonas rivipollensis TaxID=948519 RepID=UPI0038CFE4EF
MGLLDVLAVTHFEVDMPKISLVVGNGFSISFGYFSGLINELNSQEPLSWDVKCPSTKGNLIDSLPRLKKLYLMNIEKPHFDIFKLALDAKYCRSIGLDEFKTTLEARHFLTLAFSMYSSRQKSIFSTDWAWFRWLKLHRDEIFASYSLNYDLLLETALDRLRKKYYSFQINHHGFGIPLVKPHGSVDFEISPNSIFYIPCYPLMNYVDLNNTDIIRLDDKELFTPRRQALCIVPNESNKYKGYQWVEPANKWFENKLKNTDFCLFIGISYFPCDREEIDRIVDSLPNECVIIVANPYPPNEFIEKIKGRPYLIWKKPEGPVDDNGALLSLKCLSSGKDLRKCFCRSGIPYQYCECH